MTQEQLEQAIKVMQACAQGKAIQLRARYKRTPEWPPVKNPNWNWDCYEYRVAPEPVTFPYTSTEEAFADAKKHGFWTKRTFSDGTSICSAITKVKEISVIIAGEEIEFRNLLTEDYRWADTGTPCGKQMLGNNG